MLDNHPVNFYFGLSFNGDDAAFQEASGISRELTTEEVSSGGENRFKYKLPNAVTHQNLVLKRAMATSGSALLKWCVSSIDGGLINPIKKHDISLSLLNPLGVVCKKWTFIDAYPVKFSISDLKSQESGLVIETIEFAYSYFTIGNPGSIQSLFK